MAKALISGAADLCVQPKKWLSLSLNGSEVRPVFIPPKEILLAFMGGGAMPNILFYKDIR